MLVSPQQVTDATNADASDINVPVNQIANVINGNIENDNISAGAAISGSKLASNSVNLGTIASSWDGWVAVSDTWTYGSATTITVPSDATGKYSAGDRIRIVQSATTKYFLIQSVAATTLTITGGGVYTFTNNAVSSIYYSKVLNPLGFTEDLKNPYKFFAYKSTGPQNTVSGTKVTFAQELFDTNNNYDAVTNNRYTIPVTGFYTFSASAYMSSAAGFDRVLFYKNGTALLTGIAIGNASNSDIIVSALIPIMSFTAGDYIEVFYVGSSTLDIQGSIAVGSQSTFFSGYLVSRA